MSTRPEYRDFLVRAARLLLPVREAGQNRGRFVETIIRTAGGKAGEPWCAYFVYYVGHGLFGKQWPLPKTGSCDVLLKHCVDRQMMSPVPIPGGLFFVMRPGSETDAVHVGFVANRIPDADDDDRDPFETVEGNSNDKGVRDGDGVVSNVRGRTGYDTYRFTQAIV